MEVGTQILSQVDLIPGGAALTLFPADKKDGLDTSRWLIWERMSLISASQCGIVMTPLKEHHICSRAGKCSPWCSKHARLGVSCSGAPLAAGHVNVVSWFWRAKSLLSWALARLAPSCARSTVFTLLPGEVGALQV